MSIVWKGNKDLEPLLMPLDSIDEDPKNVRLHPEANLNAIRMSFTTFGQTKPIVIWRAEPGQRPIALAGNGTHRTLRALGWTHVAVSEYPSGNEAKARAYAIVDNKVPELAEWDEPALAEQMEWIATEFKPEQDGPDWAPLDAGFEGPSTPKPNTTGADGLTHRERERANSEDAPEIDVDKVEEVCLVQRGELYQLGAHRILCGDSTDPAAIARLMNGELATLVHADPPYGMNKSGVINDELHGDKLDAFQNAWWKACRPALVENASAFVWGNPEDLWRWWFKSMALDESLSLRNEVVWDKGEGPGMLSDEMRSLAITTERALVFLLGQQKLSINADNYWNGWEPLRSALEGELKKAGWTNKDVLGLTGTHMYKHWFTRSQWTMITEDHYLKLQAAGKESGAFQYPYAAVRGVYEAAKVAYDEEIKSKFYGGRAYFDNTHDNMGEVWSFPRVSGAERFGHNTPKPVAMISRAIKTLCPSGGVVLEPFSGSGSTLIAAEETGRKCYTMELSPKYVATTIRRWEQRTGLKAERVFQDEKAAA